MFYHVKEMEYDVRVEQPDPHFATLLLEQFGGGNGELKAAMQYFVQAFACKHPYPKLYDLLMDIATEELSHLEMVGATITLLMDGLNGELKNATERTQLNNLMGGSYLSKLMGGSQSKEEMIHMLVTPHAMVLTGGGPNLTDSFGNPWTASFVNANGDPTVDLRSNIAAESRAKIVYEYLLQFTDDPGVKDTVKFLMTREIAHFQQFTAALDTIQPNFPPGILKGDVRFTHMAVNASEGNERGPWNEGQGPWPSQESWDYVQNPIQHVRETACLKNHQARGTSLSPEEAKKAEEELSKLRSQEIKMAMQKAGNRWNPM